jgi:prephenate dehydrogenase
MKITIVGCGLIGGSIALALRRRRPDYSVVCLDLQERLPAMREAGLSDPIGTMADLATHIPDSSVVHASPIGSGYNFASCPVFT